MREKNQPIFILSITFLHFPYTWDYNFFDQKEDGEDEKNTFIRMNNKHSG